MNRRVTVAIVLVVVVVVVLIALIVARERPEAPSDEIRVVAIINLSGVAAQFDAVKRQTLEVGLDRIRKLHPDTSIRLQVMDAGGGAEATTVAVRRAIDWKAQYFLSGTSPTALAIAAQVRGLSPPVVQMANAANPEFGPPRRGEYRLWPDWTEEAQAVAELLEEEDYDEILVIHSADPYSESLKKALEEALGMQGRVSASYQQFDPATAPDFRPALTRAKEAGSDAVVVFGLPPGIRALVAQMQQVDWQKAVIGGVNINLAREDFEASGLPGTLWSLRTPTMEDSLPEGSEAREFRTAYEDEYGETLPFHAVYLADGLYFIHAGETEVPAGTAVEAVEGVKSFESASGTIGVSERGVLLYPLSRTRLVGRE